MGERGLEKWILGPGSEKADTDKTNDDSSSAGPARDEDAENGRCMVSEPSATIPYRVLLYL
jgi:hypothetical protein